MDTCWQGHCMKSRIDFELRESSIQIHCYCTRPVNDPDSVNLIVLSRNSIGNKDPLSPYIHILFYLSFLDIWYTTTLSNEQVFGKHGVALCYSIRVLKFT